MSDPPIPRTKALYFEQSNIDQDESIIFLHGGSGSHIEWKAVASQQALTNYHLLLVDLPGHSESRSIGPFTLETAAEEVQKLIRGYAHRGKAHVVGFSLGGFVALVLTRQYPDAVLSTFATGAYPYRGIFKWAMARPRLMWLVNSVENLPGLAAMTLRLQGIDGEEWLAEMRKNKSWEQSKAVMRELHAFELEDVRAVGKSGIRTCVVAGGKMDQVDAVREMGTVLKTEGKKKGVLNESVVVREAYHPWHLQFPALFAAGVKAWIRDESLPDDFEII